MTAAPSPAQDADGGDQRNGKAPGGFRGRWSQTRERPQPWRVEGAPSGSSGPPKRRPRFGRFWWLLVAALLADASLRGRALDAMAAAIGED